MQHLVWMLTYMFYVFFIDMYSASLADGWEIVFYV